MADLARTARWRAALARLGLVLAGLVCGVLVFAAGYEAVGRWRYERWKADFDNNGWLELVTVASPDPVLVWEYRPHGRYVNRWIPLIETNEWGFRAGPRSPAPRSREGVCELLRMH